MYFIIVLVVRHTEHIPRQLVTYVFKTQRETETKTASGKYRSCALFYI